MEGKSRAPEITIAPAPRPVADGDAAKAAGKEPMSPGTPSSSVATTGRSSRSKESRGAEGSGPLPAWKLDALCQEYSSPPAVRARFLYF